MVKNKIINIPLLCFGLLGCALSYFLGEMLLMFLNPLPYIIQCGIYMVFAAAVCGAVILVSEFAASGGYVQRWRTHFYKDSIKALLLCLPAAFIIGLATQFLYGLTSEHLFPETYNFQGTMLICDTSGSMSSNDPERSAVVAMISYIDEVPLGEYVGVITFSDAFETLRGYKILESEEEREELKEYLDAVIRYDGGTNTQEALIASISEVRKTEGRYPGLIILFSDGLANYPFSYSEIQKAARGGDEYGYDVPINTVYYASNSLGGYQMSRIAQITGGTYNYFSVKDKAGDVFSKSRASYSAEKLHLLEKTFGEKRNSPVRIILQILFISIWCFSISLVVVLMLDNKNLLRDFLPQRVLVSVAAGIVFTLLLNIWGYEMSGIARLILIGLMVVLFIPTYRLTSSREAA